MCGEELSQALVGILNACVLLVGTGAGLSATQYLLPGCVAILPSYFKACVAISVKAHVWTIRACVAIASRLLH